MFENIIYIYLVYNGHYSISFYTVILTTFYINLYTRTFCYNEKLEGSTLTQKQGLTGPETLVKPRDQREESEVSSVFNSQLVRVSYKQHM